MTIWDEVRRINAGGTTVFLTTQYLEEADQLCDRVAIIDDGRDRRRGHARAAEVGDRPRRRLGLARRRRRERDEAALGGPPASSASSRSRMRWRCTSEDGPGSIAEIVRRLDGEQIRSGRSRSRGRRSTTCSCAPPGAGWRAGMSATQPARHPRERRHDRGPAARPPRGARGDPLPEATIPTLFIPLFFLAVNIGQVSKTFPSNDPVSATARATSRFSCRCR